MASELVPVEHTGLLTGDDVPEIFSAPSGKPVVACDLDEVLGQFVEALVRYHNHTHGTQLTLDDFNSYRFADVWGGTDAEATEKVHAFFDSPFFQQELKVVPDALGHLQQLTRHYDFVIVTSRQHVIAEETRRWVARHFPKVFCGIMFGNHWGTHGEKKSKREMCAMINAKFLIDDAVHYALDCAPDMTRVFLFGEYPWNRCEDGTLPDNVHRVSSWDEVAEQLLQLLQQRQA